MLNIETTLIKPLISYRSPPADQTFLALMKMIRCALNTARLLAASKSENLGYPGILKISGFPVSLNLILIIVSTCPFPSSNS